MSKYRKVILAAVGLLLLILNDVFGITALAGMEDTIGAILISVLTAAGVWAVPNTPARWRFRLSEL